MAGSINEATILGRMGQDPDIKMMGSGDRVANLSIATSESWKNKQTGEKNERTQWHRVVVFNQPLIGVIEKYLKKGDQVYIRGQIETRKWTDQSGTEKYTTEIVLRPFNSQLVLLGGNKSQDSAAAPASNAAPASTTPAPFDELEDEIPFGFIIPLLSALLPFLLTGGVA